MARVKSKNAQVEGEAAATVYRLSSAAQAAGSTPYLLEDSIGTGTWQGKPIFDQEQVIAQLDQGTEIEGKTITFSFLDGPTTVGLYNKAGRDDGEAAGYSPLSEAQKAVTREAMVLWDELIAPSVVEKTGNGADIVLANTSTGPEVAWAYSPSYGRDHHKILSDVWIADPVEQPISSTLYYGEQGQNTLVHEIGHSLGLSHPGNYNNGADNDGDGQPDPITYAGNAEYAQDSQQFSVMSYFADDELGGWVVDVSLILLSSPQTPMIHDILTIQDKYGADLTTRADDTVYFANSTAGNAYFDLAENPFPFLAVYDAGGNDTFDFSTANTGVFLDLRPGAFSSATRGYLSLDEANAARAEANALAGAEWRTPLSAEVYDGWVGFVTSMGESRVAADTGISGINSPSIRNVSIAYNTMIENAIGGAARDYLLGNDVANVLKGNGGDDVLNGLGGDDQLWGGAGADEFRFFDASGDDLILDFASGTDTILLNEIDADTGAADDQAFSFIADAAFSGTAGELRSYASGGATFLAGDVNGDAVPDFTIGLGSAYIVLSDIFL